ncbi:MAG TPA: acylphosphatase [Rhodocyclaceae bacterium]|nr:acylphosphatase [Rhodocyclaceae bacterium]HRQ46133.1 acylphosphatase [Rhodocyclaceae bacterium]
MQIDQRDDRAITRHLLIHGRVQGVYYRASAQAEAQRLGLCGWVRNRHSGEVEAVVYGAETAVAAFIAWARKGPPAARVERLEITETDAPEMESFSLRPTE